MTLRRLDHLTFKGNLRDTRYGWLRLTPAYSVHLVTELLGNLSPGDVVLDPFCGTGTTALVCAERGIACDTTDINPFLVWLAKAKTRAYNREELGSFKRIADRVRKAISAKSHETSWAPPLFQIEKWWDEASTNALSRAFGVIKTAESDHEPDGTVDLLKLVFCRTIIECANVSFGHQSMSFKKNGATGSLFGASAAIEGTWTAAAESIGRAAETPVLHVPHVVLCDARDLRTQLAENSYSCVITSPPYPNRMSYIRELRPYMYWLGYLSDGKAAGELDWQAIGGTWGSATSNVGKWKPESERAIPFNGFSQILSDIAVKSPVLSKYVHKYFYDMISHCKSMFAVLKPGGQAHYIVGNSKFYDVMLPVEGIFAGMFESVGFSGVDVRTIRKRTSKKELFEFVVSAKKPAATANQKKPRGLPKLTHKGPKPLLDC